MAMVSFDGGRGISGGVVGRLINKRIDNKQVEKLFVV